MVGGRERGTCKVHGSELGKTKTSDIWKEEALSSKGK